MLCISSASLLLKADYHGELCAADTDVCLGFVSTHTRIHTRTHGERQGGRERERSAVSHGCEPLQKISPHLLLSPPPHLASIIPVFFFEATRMTAKNRAGKWRRAWNTFDRSPSHPVVPPFVACWPLVRSRATRTFTHRLCTVPVAIEGRGGGGRRSGGGWSTGTSSTVRSSPLLFSEGREVKPPASQPREKRSVN